MLLFNAATAATVLFGVLSLYFALFLFSLGGAGLFITPDLLSKELGSRGIRATNINPGIIETDQVSGLTPEHRARYEAMAAPGRLGQPEDIADVAVFLASDMSRFVSGATIAVDGGI